MNMIFSYVFVIMYTSADNTVHDTLSENVQSKRKKKDRKNTQSV